MRLIAQVDPHISDVINSTHGRSDNVYLAVLVLLFCTVFAVGLGFLAYKIVPLMLSTFQAELRAQREQDNDRTTALLAALDRNQEKNSTHMAQILTGFTQACEMILNNQRKMFDMLESGRKSPPG